MTVESMEGVFVVIMDCEIPKINGTELMLIHKVYLCVYKVCNVFFTYVWEIVHCTLCVPV